MSSVLVYNPRRKIFTFVNKVKIVVKKDRKVINKVSKVIICIPCLIILFIYTVYTYILFLFIRYNRFICYRIYYPYLATYFFSSSQKYRSSEIFAMEIERISISMLLYARFDYA